MASPTQPAYSSPAAATAELWRRCYVAETELQAHAQALRQFEAFHGAVILAHSISGRVAGTDEWDCEIDFPHDAPVPVRVVDVLSLEGWDGDTLCPEWRITPVEPDQVVTDRRGRVFCMGDVEDLGYTAPGVGSRKGFGHHVSDNLIEPIQDQEGGSADA